MACREYTIHVSYGYDYTVCSDYAYAARGRSHPILPPQGGGPAAAQFFCSFLVPPFAKGEKGKLEVRPVPAAADTPPCPS